MAGRNQCSSFYVFTIVGKPKELVNSGRPSSFYLENVLHPEANKTKDLINEIKNKLSNAAQKAIRPGLIV